MKKNTRKNLRQLLTLCLCGLLLLLATGCQAQEADISLPAGEELEALESAVGYELDTLLDTLGLSEEDLTEPDLADLVPGLRDTNRYVELDTIRLRERIQINSDPAGTEYYGFSQYYLLYYPEKEGEDLVAPARALYDTLLETYGTPQSSIQDNMEPVTEEDWEKLSSGDETNLGDSWQVDEYTVLYFYVLLDGPYRRIELMYDWPELYQTRMVNQGNLDREDAPLYLEGVE